MFHNQWQYLHFTRRNMAAGSVHIAPRQVEDCVGLYGCQPPHQLLTSPPPAAETPGRPQRSDECPPSSSLIVSECGCCVLCIVAAVRHSCSPHLASSPATSCCRVARDGIMPRHQIQIQHSTPHSHPPTVCLSPNTHMHCVVLPPSQNLL